jgi:CBS domain-containing protein
MMGAVSNLLDSKGYDVLTVKPDQPVHEALVNMAKMSAGTSVVMDGGEVVGIFSERDVIRKIVLQGKDIDSVLVKEIMSTDLTTVTTESSLDHCMKLMTDKRIRHLPVMRDKQLCGIVSIGDVVKYLVVEKDFKIKNLESYISGVM